MTDDTSIFLIFLLPLAYCQEDTPLHYRPYI